MQRLILVSLLFTGCATTSTTYLSSKPEGGAKCEVKMVMDPKQVPAGVQEVCAVTALSGSVTVALEKAKDDVADCNVCNAYVKDVRHPSFWDSAAVTVVGYK